MAEYNNFLKYGLTPAEEKRVYDQYKEYLVRASKSNSVGVMSLEQWFMTATGKAIYSDRTGRMAIDFGYDAEDPTFGQSAMLQFKLTHL